MNEIFLHYLKLLGLFLFFFNKKNPAYFNTAVVFYSTEFIEDVVRS